MCTLHSGHGAIVATPHLSAHRLVPSSPHLNRVQSPLSLPLSPRPPYIMCAQPTAAYEAAFKWLLEDTTSLFLDAPLYLRLQFLVADLLHFDAGEERLYYGIGFSECDVRYHQLFLSPFYFLPDEQLKLAMFPAPDGQRFQDVLARRMSDKFSAKPSEEGGSPVSSSAPYVCSSHDLAPLYRAVFHLQAKFYSTTAFAAQHKQWVRAREKNILRQQKEKEAAAAVSSSSTSSSTSAASLSAALQPDDSVASRQLESIKTKLASLRAEAKEESCDKQRINAHIDSLMKEQSRMEKKLARRK